MPGDELEGEEASEGDSYAKDDPHVPHIIRLSKQRLRRASVLAVNFQHTTKPCRNTKTALGAAHRCFLVFQDLAHTESVQAPKARDSDEIS